MSTPEQQPGPSPATLPPAAAPPSGPAFSPGVPNTPQPEYAPFSRRVAAVLLDGLVAMLVYLVVFAVVAVVYRLLGTVNSGLAVGVVALLGVAAYVALLFWSMVLEAAPYGQTVGKRLMNIRVVDRSGALLSKGTSVGRYFSRIVSAMPMYIGFLFPLWDREKRALHDMIVDTRVIRAGDSPPLGAVATAPFKRGNAASG